MLEIDILEGARGTGKSSIAFKLRQLMSDTTLINFTGFSLDGEEGLEKVDKYYRSWITTLFGMNEHKFKFVFDRFYYSEAVYSKLYKSYNFERRFNLFNDCMYDLSDKGVKINIYFLTINNEEELKQRLIRDKVPFGKAEESVKETKRQQELYGKIFEDFKQTDNFKIHTIDTSDRSTDDVFAQILKIKMINEITDNLKTTE